MADDEIMTREQEQKIMDDWVRSMPYQGYGLCVACGKAVTTYGIKNKVRYCRDCWGKR